MIAHSQSLFCNVLAQYEPRQGTIFVSYAKKYPDTDRLRNGAG